MERSWAGSDAAKAAEERKKKIVLAVVSVLLLGVLAFQLPRMLKRLHPASSAAAPTSATSNPSTGVDPFGSLIGKSAKRSPLPARLSAKDPFSPLIRDDKTGGSSSGSAYGPSSANPTATNANALSKPGAAPKNGAIPFTQKPLAPGGSTPGVSVSAAVIWINDSPQIVGLAQAFPAAAPAFKLVSVNAKAVKIRVAGGRFADGRSTITVRRGHGVTLVNTTTGVRYDIRFAAPTTAPVAMPTSATAPQKKK
jgi:hypothetical protein